MLWINDSIYPSYTQQQNSVCQYIGQIQKYIFFGGGPILIRVLSSPLHHSCYITKENIFFLGEDRVRLNFSLSRMHNSSTVALNENISFWRGSNADCVFSKSHFK